MKINECLALVFVTAMATTTAAQIDSLKYQDPRYVKAMAMDEAGKHAAAIKAYDALAEDPAMRAVALTAKSECQFSHQHLPKEAFETIRLAIEADPGHFAGYFNRSAMYQNMGMVDRALADLEKAERIATTDELRKSVHLNRGSCYLQVRKWNEALACFDRALALDSTDVGSWLNKSVVLDEVGRAPEALDILLRLHRADSLNTTYLNNIGFFHNNQENFVEAARWFRRSMELDPKDAVVMNNLGYAELRSGQVEEALRHVQRSIELYPANSYAYRNLGYIWQEKGEKDKACDAFEEAMARGYTEQYGPAVKDAHASYCR